MKDLEFEYAHRWADLGPLLQRAVESGDDGAWQELTGLLEERDRNLEDYLGNGAAGTGPLARVILDESSTANVDSAVGYTSASFSMQPGELYLVAFVWQRAAGGAPASQVTHSGGATFTEIHTATYGGGSGARISVFRCQPNSFYGPGTINLTCASAGIALIYGIWNIIGFSGAFDDRANNGVGAILAFADRGATTSTTTSTLVLATRVTSPDAIYAAFGIGTTNTTATPGATFNQLALSTADNAVLLTEYKYGDNTSDAVASWPVSTSNQGIILAIRGVVD